LCSSSLSFFFLSIPPSVRGSHLYRPPPATSPQISYLDASPTRRRNTKRDKQTVPAFRRCNIELPC
jgi:hypothetical protein